MNWKPFDTRAFLKASKYWDDDIKKLEQELDSMSELPSIDNQTGVRGSEVSNITQRMALRRLEIASQIEELKLNKEMLRYGLKSLDKRDRELIEGMFFSDLPKWKVVLEFGLKYGMCDTLVYEERDRALRRMGNNIDVEFYDAEPEEY